MRVTRYIAACICLLMLIFLPTMQVSAMIPYDSYTYLSDGERVIVPHAYTPIGVEMGESMGFTLNNPQDMCVDADGWLYICDTDNHRILRIDPEHTAYSVIDSFVNGEEKDTFQNPTGVYVDEEGNRYIADSKNGRVVVLDEQGGLIHLLGRPDTNLIDEELTYTPLKVTADKYGRIYIVAENITMGVIVYDAGGTFTGFLGSQKVTYNVADYLWKRFMTDEQTQRMQDFIPMSYSNVVCDADGFVYAVNAALDPDDLVSTITSKAKDGRTTPIKKLNQLGEDVLLRTGAYAPVGDIEYDYTDEGEPQLSAIVDVALGAEGTYSLLDRQRSRVFTYSSRGDLLHVFGAQSTQTGNIVTPAAIAYRGTDILVLDQKMARVTIYEQTEYGAELLKALSLSNQYLLDAAIEQWKVVLSYNPNSALAYDGIGLSLLQGGEYQQAMEYFTLSENSDQYAEAFEGYRKTLVKQYFLLVILAVVVILFVIYRIVLYLIKVNRSRPVPGKRNLWKKICYGFYLLFHPFDGFWDLKHEGRGELLGGLLILIASTLSEVLKALFSDKAFGLAGDYSVFQIVLRFAGMVLLFAVANWCLTTLMDGKGKLTDILMVCSYATLPALMSNLLIIPLSHVLIESEAMYLTFFGSLGNIWMIFLIFSGVMVIQQYTFVKNIATSVMSIACMGVITFIIILLLTTLVQISNFAQTLILELTR